MDAKKLQGFNFDKVMTPDNLIEYCEDSGIAIEDLEASKYYDSLGKTDYITDTSLAVVEDDGKYFKTIYHNKNTKKPWFTTAFLLLPAGRKQSIITPAP